jgi:hypothetical protein
VWGTTVEGAATARAEELAGAAGTLADLTALAERCLLAALPGALPAVMRALAARAALDSDAAHLAQALPALVRAVRYGDVRGTDGSALTEVATGLAERICVGLPPACTGLDAAGAAELRGHVTAVHRAIALLAPAEDPAGTPATATTPADAPPDGLRARWEAVLRGLAERDAGVHGMLRGTAARLLLDEGRLPDGDAARLMGLALSPGTPPQDAAAWIEGFLAGGGMLLVHDERLLGLVDGWLSRVPDTAFEDVLPLLRRTFAEFETGVRRTLGELVRRGPAASGARGGGTGTLPGFGPALDEGRVGAALATVRLLLSGGGTAAPDTAAPDTGGPGTSAPGGVRNAPQTAPENAPDDEEMTA